MFCLQVLRSKFPLHCCTVEGLLTLTRLIPHEEAVQQRIVAVIDVSTPASEILFISHKWLADRHPDDLDGSKLAQIKKMLRKNAMKNIKYVWLDYMSIPQDSQEELQRAIESLPFYINSCRRFVSLVGEGGRAAQDVYDQRGWCRLECMAANSPVNPDSKAVMYIHNKHTDKLEQYVHNRRKTKAQSNPLEGDFTDEGDRVKISQMLIFLADTAEINPNDDIDREVARYIRLSAVRQLAIQVHSLFIFYVLVLVEAYCIPSIFFKCFLFYFLKNLIEHPDKTIKFYRKVHTQTFHISQLF